MHKTGQQIFFFFFANLFKENTKTHYPGTSTQMFTQF